MKSSRAIEDFRRLHKRTAWDLLSATSAPVVLGILQTHLYGKERSLPASVFVERVSMDLDDLRARGEDWPMTVQQYVYIWLTNGYVERKLAPGAAEEDYELTPGAIDAIRFVVGMDRAQTSATESRLSTVINKLAKLADDTNTDKARRIDRLVIERDKIDAQIDAIDRGHMKVLSYDEAMERTRDIILLSADIPGDFRHLRDKFFHLTQDLRETIMSHEGGRGIVLEEAFAGFRRIDQSEAGRTFNAFWALLTDPLQSAILDEAIDEILTRTFAGRIEKKDRAFLLGMKKNLHIQSEEVQREFGHFRSSLTNYVKSTDYLEQRRLNALIKEAQRAALTVKNTVQPFLLIAFHLRMITSSLVSVSQLRMHDPDRKPYCGTMDDARSSDISLVDIRAMLELAEIDFAALRNDVAAVLATCDQATIADVLDMFPARQGLGSVLGLYDIGWRIGIPGNGVESVRWTGQDGKHRAGTIPVIYFVKEKSDGPT
jgi:hypothetical protein